LGYSPDGLKDEKDETMLQLKTYPCVSRDIKETNFLSIFSEGLVTSMRRCDLVSSSELFHIKLGEGGRGELFKISASGNIIRKLKLYIYFIKTTLYYQFVAQMVTLHVIHSLLFVLVLVQIIL